MDKLTKGADRFKSKSDFNLNLKANECDEDIVKENMVSIRVNNENGNIHFKNILNFHI